MQNNAVRGQENRIATVTAAARSVHRNMCTTSHLSYRKIVLKAECVYFSHICEYIPSCKYATIYERDAARCSCIIFVFDSRRTVWVHSYRVGVCVRCYMEIKSVKRASERVRERELVISASSSSSSSATIFILIGILTFGQTLFLSFSFACSSASSQ